MKKNKCPNCGGEVYEVEFLEDFLGAHGEHKQRETSGMVCEDCDSIL